MIEEKKAGRQRTPLHKRPHFLTQTAQVNEAVALD